MTTQRLGAFAAAVELYFIFGDALAAFASGPIIWCLASRAAKRARWCLVSSSRVQADIR